MDQREELAPREVAPLVVFFAASAKAWRLDRSAKETGDPRIALHMAANAAVARVQAHMALDEVWGGGGG